MKARIRWVSKSKFEASNEAGQAIMDAKPPFGDGSGMSPKELVLSGVAGCTAMDVVALLKKYKQSYSAFEIEAEASVTNSGYPVVFKEVTLVYRFEAQEIDSAKVLDAIYQSQTKFCGVSAMISKVAPISYSVFINGTEVGKGKADFNF